MSDDEGISLAKITKRNECMSDLVTDGRELVFIVLLNIWKQVYEDKKIPERHWLPKFQTSLKTTTQYTDTQLEEFVSKHLKRRKYVLDCLHHVYTLTARIEHDMDALMIKKDEALLVDFVRQALVQSARALWYKPYLMYYYTHKKDKLKGAKDEMDKMFKTSLKYVARQLTSEMVMAQEALVEKQKHLMLYTSQQAQQTTPTQPAPIDNNAPTHPASRPLSEYADDSDTSSSYLSSSSEEDDATDVESLHSQKSRTSRKSHTSRVSRDNMSIKSAPASPKPSYGLDPTTNALTPISRAASVASKAILSESDDSNELFIPRNKKKRITSLDLKIKRESDSDSDNGSKSNASDDSGSVKSSEPAKVLKVPSKAATPPVPAKSEKQPDKKILNIENVTRDAMLVSAAAPKRLVRRVYYEGNKKLKRALEKKPIKK